LRGNENNVPQDVEQNSRENLLKPVHVMRWWKLEDELQEKFSTASFPHIQFFYPCVVSLPFLLLDFCELLYLPQSP
jgi:hypothetical protein